MTLLRPTSLNEIYGPIDKELQEFSGLLKRELTSEDELIRNIHEHLLKISGKYLRPALAIFASRLNGQSSSEAVRLAVAIELIHTATLVHDDIIDDSELRRNQPTIYSKWGREISIVSGDYLYAKAFLLLAALKNTWISEAFATCAHLMCEGEMKQIEKRNGFLMSEGEYLTIIHQKTAALFQAACMGGAYYSGAGEPVIEIMGRYGFRLGMAFQIVDDCLDLAGETESLGKKTGLDVYKNDVSLPLLYLFQDLEEGQRRFFLAALQQKELGVFDQIRAMAREKNSVERAMQKARSYADKCLEDLHEIGPSVYRECLIQLAHHCLERRR